MNEDGPKPLAERPLEELQSLLEELEADEATLIKLKNDNPEIAKLPNQNEGLTKEKYIIWQNISRLDGVQFRIASVKKAMAGKTS